MTDGSTIIPTEMKNTEPNRSLTGETTRSMRSAKLVPASMEPMTNAPSASENPQNTENTAMPRQSPIDTMSSVSELRYRRQVLSSVGRTNTPTANHMTRKNTSLVTLKSISPPWSELFMAIDDRITIINTAKRSSTMSTAKTRPANFLCCIPRSLKALIMMVVDDIDSIPPRKRLLMFENPSR